MNTSTLWILHSSSIHYNTFIRLVGHTRPKKQKEDILGQKVTRDREKRERVQSLLSFELLHQREITSGKSSKGWWEERGLEKKRFDIRLAADSDADPYTAIDPDGDASVNKSLLTTTHKNSLAFSIAQTHTPKNNINITSF